jgi:epsilon-lactone hydrolase
MISTMSPASSSAPKQRCPREAARHHDRTESYITRNHLAWLELHATNTCFAFGEQSKGRPMASWQAHAMDLFIRMHFKRRLAGKKDLARARSILSGGVLPVPAGASFRETTLAGITGEWVAPAHRIDTPRVLLYLHGGGYFTGSPKAHRPITASLANAGFNVFVPQYRLAPEHPFPAAVDDAETVWEALVALGFAPSSIAISGDSAGGGLALALMIRLRNKGRALPAAAALFSPWTDLAVTGESILVNARREAMFGAREVRIAADWYLNGAEPVTPEASPLYSSLAGLPPLFIDVGERELLRDDSTRLAARADSDGVSVSLNVWPIVPHVWQLACSFLPEGGRSLRRAAAFLNSRAGNRGALIA